jgi:hypothetical protein
VAGESLGWKNGLKRMGGRRELGYINPRNEKEEYEEEEEEEDARKSSFSTDHTIRCIIFNVS